ncbi:MAG: twin-arginine translocase TatA/TatE family subunit [Capnocytophaga granulosa]
MLANHIFLGVIGAPQVIIIIAVALLFFGGKKIPELMRGLGGGIREFKDAMKDGEAEKKEELDKREILDRSEQLKKLEEKNQ